MVGGAGKMLRLSSHPGERALQRHVLAVAGWLVVSVLVVGGFVLATTDPAGGGDGSVTVPLQARALLGAVFVLLSLRLPLLVSRHRGELASVVGLRTQYVNGAAVTVVLGVPGFLFWWWGGPLGAAVGVLSAVLARRVALVGPDEVTGTADHLDPDAWYADAAGRLYLRRPGLWWALVVGAGLLLGVLCVGLAFLLAR